MYKKGMARWSKDGVMDSSTEDYKDVIGAFLPHSCDQWVIGGKKEILLLIKDLQELLEKYDVEVVK